MIERWTITDRAEWLQRRRPNINGSEVAALFGINPYLTPFALYTGKAGLADLSAPDSDVLRRGRILEPAVAAAVTEEHPEWKIQKAAEYIWSPDWRLGCTPDFYVHCQERGVGVLQAKTVAKPVFDEDWQDGPPQWIVLQTLQEMMLEDVAWGAIAALIMSSYTVDLRIWEFERHAPAEKRIIARATAFWADVDAGRQPKLDYDRDADVIRALFPRDNGTVVDLTGDNRLPQLLTEFEALSAVGKHAETKLKAVKAEIAAKIGDASVATLPGWEVSHKTQRRAGYVVKDTEFRVLRVKRTGKQEMAA
jgi:predicted phage-related endonuclease